MDAQYEIVKYGPAHKPQVAELQTGLWATDLRLNTRYLEWKYEGNAQLDEPLIYLAIWRGAPVAMRGFHEARLEAGKPSRAFRVLIAGDAYVAPAHRNRGLVTRIMHFAYADLADREFGYFVSLGGASRINALGLMTLGWKSFGGLRPMGRITTKAARRQRLRRVLARTPGLWRFSEARALAFRDQRDPFRRLDAAFARRASAEQAPITLATEPRLDAILDLVERIGHDGRIRYTRDRAYLEWRFRNPLSDYRFLYWQEARVEGYLVLSRRRSDLGSFDRVYIADFEATSPRIGCALLGAAIDLGRFPELVTWTSTLTADEVRVLEHHGFAPVDADDTAHGCPSVMVRPLGDGVPASAWVIGDRKLLDARDWDVRVLYSMRG
jgi:hypothetical protein